MCKLSRRRFSLASLAALAPGAAARAQPGAPRLWPADGAANVNPDTCLTLAFPGPVRLGRAGLIRIVDAETGRVVDTLDVSVPAGPDWRRRRPAGSPPDTTVYQAYAIGGVEGFHAQPVITRGRMVTIQPHHHRLEYGRRYTVQIDPGVLEPAGAAPSGLAWTFATKRTPPPAGSTRLTVAADGSGDFDTIQGAVDFVPDKPARRVTILIKPGVYEALVYIRNKSNLVIRGESRDGVTVRYGNNSAFNPAKPRYVFTLADCTDVQLSTFTIKNDYFGQAEALMIRGQRIVVDRMDLDGSGDALQLGGGTIYFTRTKLRGDGDTILTTAAAFFDRCEIRSLGPAIWPRNTAANHGLVFKDCRFVALHEPLPWTRTPDGGGQISTPTLARLPDNGGRNYPHAEVVLLNCDLRGYPPEAWGPVQAQPAFDWSNVRFWEFATTEDGKPADMSKRHPIVRRLALPKDGGVISDYSRPEFVLAGWKPVVHA